MNWCNIMSWGEQFENQNPHVKPEEKSEEKPVEKLENKFIIYPLLDCPNCKKMVDITTNDGNRFQSCSKCNWTWRAPK